jgi:CRP-like cAMP-binding protein
LTASKQIFAEGDVGDQAYRIVEGSIEISIQGWDEVDIG